MPPPPRAQGASPAAQWLSQGWHPPSPGCKGKGLEQGLGGLPHRAGGGWTHSLYLPQFCPPPSPIPQGRLNLAVTYSLGWREQAQAFPPPPHYSTQPPFRFYPKPF